MLWFRRCLALEASTTSLHGLDSKLHIGEINESVLGCLNRGRTRVNERELSKIIARAAMMADTPGSYWKLSQKFQKLEEGEGVGAGVRRGRAYSSLSHYSSSACPFDLVFACVDHHICQGLEVRRPRLTLPLSLSLSTWPVKPASHYHPNYPRFKGHYPLRSVQGRGR